MNDEQAIAVAENGLTPSTALTSGEAWQATIGRYKAILATGLLPTHIKTAEQALVIAMQGEELGLGPMRALNGITVIKGKPTLSAQLMLSLILERSGASMRPIEQSAERACIEWTINGEKTEIEYTMADAQRAGLASNDNYRKHPSDMLWARCVSRSGRRLFPHILGAEVYVTGELDGPSLTSPGRPRRERAQRITVSQVGEGVE